MSQLLLSGTVITAFLGGVVALLAPCCISVMLPAYFATSFHRRTQLAAMTLVFAAGIATIILPLGLGASASSRLLVGQHRFVFSVGGVLMIAAGVAMVAGWKFMLPLPGRRGGGHGVGAVYSLGLFSGAASACCAPVLAGVAALAGAAASFPVAVTVGSAYVAGMVAPLAVLALVWDKRDWGRARIFGDWGVTIRVGFRRRRISGPALLSGGLLATMGVLTIAFAVRGPAMKLSGWQLQVSAWLGHASAIVERHLVWLPGWAGLVLLIAAVTVFVRATRHRDAPPQDGPPSTPTSGDTGRIPTLAGSRPAPAPVKEAQPGTMERIH
jgi:cytochrome c-type biogenesis protein